jgi:hypothetical protein
MSKALIIFALCVVSCGPKSASNVAPPSRGSSAVPIQADIGGVSYGGATYGGATYGGTSYGGALPRGGPLTWTVKVTDNATGAALSKISITAVEQTWDCKTRVLPTPPQDPDDRHRPPTIETYDCKGGKHQVTKLTDARGEAILELPHSQYQLAKIEHKAYFPPDFPDPMFQRIASSLVKTSITNGGAGRRTYSALKVKTDAEAEALALQNPIVKKCVAQHPTLTRAIQKPSLMWRVQFLYSGAKNLEFLSTVDSISGDVGIMGCWDPCCAGRAPSRFERRLTECAKLRAATSAERKPWDCDTLAQDFVRLQDFNRKQGDTAALQKYEDLYRAYEAGK